MYNYLGRRIYYLKSNGNVVLNTGERKGNVVKTTIDEDFSMYNRLSRYNRDKLDVIELKFGEYKTEFKECTSYRVNIDTKKLEFDYSEIPPSPDVPQTPSIHERVDRLEQISDEQDLMISELYMI